MRSVMAKNEKITDHFNPGVAATKHLLRIEDEQRGSRERRPLDFMYDIACKVKPAIEVNEMNNFF